MYSTSPLLALIMQQVLDFNALVPKAQLFVTLCLGNVIVSCDERVAPFRTLRATSGLHELVQGCTRFIERKVLHRAKQVAEQCMVLAGTYAPVL